MTANTPSQRWVRSHNACFGGRRRLGRRSLAQYWATVADVDLHDLYWIARKLRVPYRVGETLVETETRQERYAQAVYVAYYRANCGRWKGKHVRGALEEVISRFNVHFPMWCF